MTPIGAHGSLKFMGPKSVLEVPPEAENLEKADVIVSAVLTAFEKATTPGSRPRKRDNGVQEWAPLSGIVLESPNLVACVAFATGTKCLPAIKLPEVQGTALHDSHAEILAIRAFNYFLLRECRDLGLGIESRWLRKRGDDEMATLGEHQPRQRFVLKDSVRLHMFTSEGPCGDASMESIMDRQEDPTPWEPGRRMPSASATTRGRNFFSELGVVRTKPGRNDSPPSLAKSCSDKLTLKQCTSLLSAVTSLLISPEGLYLSQLIIPSSSIHLEACKRAFSDTGRMASLADKKWSGGYSFVPFAITPSRVDFRFSKVNAERVADRTAAQPISLIYAHNAGLERIVGGIRQGCTSYGSRSASKVSRIRMVSLVFEVASLSGVHAPAAATYRALKEGELLRQRRAVKQYVYDEVLQDWERNGGDDDFVTDSS